MSKPLRFASIFALVTSAATASGCATNPPNGVKDTVNPLPIMNIPNPTPRILPSIQAQDNNTPAQTNNSGVISPEDALCFVNHPTAEKVNIAIVFNIRKDSDETIKDIPVQPNGNHGGKLTGFSPVFGELSKIAVSKNACILTPANGAPPLIFQATKPLFDETWLQGAKNHLKIYKP